MDEVIKVLELHSFGNTLVFLSSSLKLGDLQEIGGQVLIKDFLEKEFDGNYDISSSESLSSSRADLANFSAFCRTCTKII